MNAKMIDIEWIYALAAFCAFLYIIFLSAQDGIRFLKEKKSLSTHVLIKLLITVAMVCGLIWFFLWMLTSEIIPNGLWGFGLASVSLPLLMIFNGRK
jgi:hypothetical protein